MITRKLLLFLLLLSVPLLAQVTYSVIIPASPPGGVGGACSSTAIAYLQPLTGGNRIVTCDPSSHLWVVGGGGGSSLTPAGSAVTDAQCWASATTLGVCVNILLSTVNKVTITAPSSGATLTLADGSSHVTVGAFASTFTFSNTTGVTFPTSGTLATTAQLPTVTGGPCTNQVVTAISSSAVPTCTTVTSAYTTGFALLAAANNFTVGPQNITLAPGAATITDGLQLYNVTAATTGNQQYSPALHQKGHGFNTNGNVDIAVDYQQYLLPRQAFNGAAGENFCLSLNGGAYTCPMLLDSAGNQITVNGQVAMSGSQVGFKASNLGLVNSIPITWAASTWDGTTSTTLCGVGGVITTGASFTCNPTGAFKATAFIAGSTTFTASGCSNSTLVGGATAGTFASGTTGACTVVITMGNSGTTGAAPTGWHCSASDRTTPANLYDQTASSTTTATLSGTTVSGDVISFACIGY